MSDTRKSSLPSRTEPRRSNTIKGAGSGYTGKHRAGPKIRHHDNGQVTVTSNDGALIITTTL